MTDLPDNCPICGELLESEIGDGMPLLEKPLTPIVLGLRERRVCTNVDCPSRS